MGFCSHSHFARYQNEERPSQYLASKFAYSERAWNEAKRLKLDTKVLHADISPANMAEASPASYSIPGSVNSPLKPKAVIGHPSKYFHTVSTLGGGNQGNAFLALPYTAIPKTPTTDWSEDDYDNLRNSLRVIKKSHGSRAQSSSRNEIELMKSSILQGMRTSARLTCYSNDLTWYAQTWSGVSVGDLLSQKDALGWRIPNRVCWEILRQGIRSLAYLHSGFNNGFAVYHGDLVDSNVCLSVVAGDEKPRLQVNFIDFGWGRAFDKNAPLHQVNGARRDVATFAEIVHCLAHPYNYLADTVTEEFPLWNRQMASYCDCDRLAQNLAIPRRNAYFENRDKDLQYFLDLLCDRKNPSQFTAAEALQYIQQRFEHKFEADYEIPYVISSQIFDKIPSNEAIKAVVDAGRAEGKIPPPPRFPYSAKAHRVRRSLAPSPRAGRPDIYLPEATPQSASKAEAKAKADRVPRKKTRASSRACQTRKRTSKSKLARKMCGDNVLLAPTERRTKMAV